MTCMSSTPSSLVQLLSVRGTRGAQTNTSFLRVLGPLQGVATIISSGCTRASFRLELTASLVRSGLDTFLSLPVYLIFMLFSDSKSHSALDYLGQKAPDLAEGGQIE